MEKAENMSFEKDDTAYRRVFRLACILIDKLPLDTVFQAFADAEWHERLGCPQHEFKVARLLDDQGESLYGLADKMADMLLNDPERAEEMMVRLREERRIEDEAKLVEFERKMNDG